MKIAQSPFSTAGTKTFAGNANDFVLYNDGTADVTFYFDDKNTEVWTVKSGESFDEQVPMFSNVTVSATTAFRSYVRR